MAIGINKHEHRLLLERINLLIGREEDPSSWIALREELEGCYAALFQAIGEVEARANLYRKVCGRIRPISAQAIRKKRRKLS